MPVKMLTCKYKGCGKKATQARAADLDRHLMSHLPAHLAKYFKYRCGFEECKVASFQPGNVQNHWEAKHTGTPLVLIPENGEGAARDRKARIILGLEDDSSTSTDSTQEDLAKAADTVESPVPVGPAANIENDTVESVVETHVSIKVTTDVVEATADPVVEVNTTTEPAINIIPVPDNSAAPADEVTTSPTPALSDSTAASTPNDTASECESESEVEVVKDRVEGPKHTEEREESVVVFNAIPTPHWHEVSAPAWVRRKRYRLADSCESEPAGIRRKKYILGPCSD